MLLITMGCKLKSSLFSCCHMRTSILDFLFFLLLNTFESGGKCHSMCEILIFLSFFFHLFDTTHSLLL